MADEKVNVSPEESKPPEAPAPSGPGEPPAPEHTEGPAVPGGDQAAPAHVEPAMPEKTEGPIKPEQSVIPGMGEDTPAPSSKVINLSDIQAADKGGKEASAPALEKKAPEADKPPKRRGRPPKEQAGPTVEKKSKAAEPRTGRPSKVDKAAREEAPPAVRDKVSRGKKADKGKETGSGGAPASKSAKAVKPGKAAPVKEAAVPPPEIKLPPTPEVPPRPVEEGKIVYLKMSELHPFRTFREHPYKVQDDKAMDDLVGTIKEHGIMTPATVRPEKDGKGYEIIPCQRRISPAPGKRASHHPLPAGHPTGCCRRKRSARLGPDACPCTRRSRTGFLSQGSTGTGADRGERREWACAVAVLCPGGIAHADPVEVQRIGQLCGWLGTGQLLGGRHRSGARTRYAAIFRTRRNENRHPAHPGRMNIAF